MYFKRSGLILSTLFLSIYGTTTEINDLNQFNNRIKEGKSVVKFYMDNCPPCNASKSMFEQLSNQYKEINFILVNFNRGRAIAIKYARSFPTFAFFKDGKKLGGNIVGYDASTRNKIISRLNAL